LCPGCGIKPDGGFYLVTPPVKTSGDGLSYGTAYVFHHVDSGYLVTAEIEFVRDKYWVTPQRSYEDFYHVVPPATNSCRASMYWIRVSRDEKNYDLITFTLPEGERTRYFNVTQQTKEH
jgi:hypothetical protein